MFMTTVVLAIVSISNDNLVLIKLSAVMLLYRGNKHKHSNNKLVKQTPRQAKLLWKRKL